MGRTALTNRHRSKEGSPQSPFLRKFRRKKKAGKQKRPSLRGQPSLPAAAAAAAAAAADNDPPYIVPPTDEEKQKDKTRPFTLPSARRFAFDPSLGSSLSFRAEIAGGFELYATFPLQIREVPPVYSVRLDFVVPSPASEDGEGSDVPVTRAALQTTKWARTDSRRIILHPRRALRSLKRLLKHISR